MEGDLVKCYGHVHSMVEKHRREYGLDQHQVFFNVDFLRGASETFDVRDSVVYFRQNLK